MDYRPLIIAVLLALAALGCRKKVVIPPDAEPPGVDAEPDPLVNESLASPEQPDTPR